jgi:hypothetical protein
MYLTTRSNGATHSATRARCKLIPSAGLVTASLFLITMSLHTTRISAQRYLTEFVGTTSIKDGTSNAIPSLPSFLDFDVLENRQVDGTFSFINPANLRSASMLAAGTLADSGNCNVQLQSSTVSGGLKLAESEFDTASFALLGRVTITQATTGGALPKGKHIGNLGVLRPIEDALFISTRDKTVSIVGNFGVWNHEDLVISGLDENFTASGRLGRSDDPAGFDVTLSSSDRWTYLVGVNEDGFLVARGAAELDSSGMVTAFRGEFQLLDSSSRLLDFGTIDVRE